MPRVKFTKDIVLAKEDCFAGQEKDLSVIDATYAVDVYSAAVYVTGAPAADATAVKDADPEPENGDPKGKKGK